MPMRLLGATGIEISLLGIGTGTNGFGGRSRQTELGRGSFVRLLEYASERGVTYFDLADQYGSHTYMRDALESGGGSIPRDRAVILTKTHARTAGQMRADLDRFRREIGTDTIDIVLLHCLFRESWRRDYAGAMEVLSEAREAGIIRAHGVSCHSLGALKTAAREPWVQVDLARLNPWGRHMDADVETVKAVLVEFRARDAGVIGMKILAQGEARGADGVRRGVRHAVDCGLLDSFTIGVRSPQELDELIAAL